MALGGGRLLPGCGASWFGRSPTTDCPSLGCATGACYPLPAGAGGVGVGICHQPHSARSCEPALHAVGRHKGARGGGGGGISCLGVGRPRLGAHPHPTALPWGVRSGPATHWLWVQGVWVLGPVTNPTGFARCWGGTRAPGGAGGRLLPGFGASVVGRSSTPDRPSLGRAAGAHYPLTVGAVCGRGSPAVRGTFFGALVRRVLCALFGFAAPGGRCRLAPVLVPWLWPAACLSRVPHGPALVPCALSEPVALGAPVGFPVAPVPSLTPEGVTPGLTWRLRGARGGRLRTGLFVPAASPCRGRAAGLAPRCTCSGPREGVVPGGSLRLWSWAACAAVVGRVWTRSLTRLVSSTARLPTGDSAGAPELFCVDADTSPFGSEDATPRSRVCVLLRAYLGRVGSSGLPGAFWCASP